MKLLYKIICTALAPVLLISCSEKIEQPDVSCGGHAYKSVFTWGKPTDIFGFQPQNRYAYCPIGELVSLQSFRLTSKDRFYSAILAETRKGPA